MSLCSEILDEWEGCCFYDDQLLSEAYTAFLLALLENVSEVDPRAIAFLKVGFEAYLREQHDPHAALTYKMALSMIGHGGDEQSPVPPPGRSTPNLQGAGF